MKREFVARGLPALLLAVAALGFASQQSAPASAPGKDKLRFRTRELARIELQRPVAVRLLTAFQIKNGLGASQATLATGEVAVMAMKTATPPNTGSAGFRTSGVVNAGDSAWSGVKAEVNIEVTAKATGNTPGVFLHLVVMEDGRTILSSSRPAPASGIYNLTSPEFAMAPGKEYTISTSATCQADSQPVQCVWVRATVDSVRFIL